MLERTGIVAEGRRRRIAHPQALYVAPTVDEDAPRPVVMSTELAVMLADAADLLVRKPVAPVERRPVSSPSAADVQRAFLEELESAGYLVQRRPLVLADLLSTNRSRTISWPRHACIDLVRRICGLSTTMLGWIFCGQNHTSIMYALRRVPEHLTDVPALGRAHAATLGRFKGVLEQ